MKLRQGRRNGRNLYLQWGDEPSDDDPCIGFFVEPNVAREIVEMTTERDEYHDDHLDAIRRIIT